MKYNLPVFFILVFLLNACAAPTASAPTAPLAPTTPTVTMEPSSIPRAPNVEEMMYEDETPAEKADFGEKVSSNPVLRLLLAGLAFVIFNLYIANRQEIAICLKHPAAPVSKHWLTLRRLVRMIAHAVEKLFDVADVMFRHPSCAFS